MKPMSSQIRMFLIVLFVLVSFIGIIFPYPFLAKFILSMIWEYAVVIWSFTSRVAETDITNLRIALTPTILVSIGLFFIIRKLGTIIDNNAHKFVRYVSLVISWYCLIATTVIIATMWFGMTVIADEAGIIVSLGRVLFEVGIR
jgi:hypothetical protein